MTETKWTNIAIPRELHKTIKDVAEKEERTIAIVVKRAIQLYAKNAGPR